MLNRHRVAFGAILIICSTFATAQNLSNTSHGPAMIRIPQPEAPAVISSAGMTTNDWLDGGRIDSKSNQTIVYYRMGWAYVFPSGLEYHKGETIVPYNGLLPHGTINLPAQHANARMESKNFVFFIEEIALADGTIWQADHKKIETYYSTVCCSE